MFTIREILQSEFPELEVDIPMIFREAEISQTELTEAIKYIKQRELVQDAEKLLSVTGPMRNAVEYPIIFPEQKRDMSFRVSWIQGPMIYIGYIQARDHLGHDVTGARLYGMRVR